MCIHVHVHVHVHVHACAHEGRCLRWAAPLACPIRATGLACLIWAMGLCCGFGSPVHIHMYMMHVHLRMGVCVCVCVCVLSFCCCCVASWASPKHDLRGSACCVCMCEPDRAEPAYAPRLGWRPSDGGRRRGRSSSLAVHASSMPGEPKWLQPTSYLEYGKRLLRGRLQQPPPRHQGTKVLSYSRQQQEIHLGLGQL